jgi:hypothetical protein
MRYRGRGLQFFKEFRGHTGFFPLVGRIEQAAFPEPDFKSVILPITELVFRETFTSIFKEVFQPGLPEPEMLITIHSLLSPCHNLLIPTKILPPNILFLL